MKSLLLLTTFTIIVYSGFAHAEVMDKEWSITSLVVFGMVNAILLFTISRYKPMYLLLFILISAFLSFAHLLEVFDTFVGPAIKLEAGNLYVYISLIIPIIWVVCCIAGYWLNHKQRISITALGR